MPNNKLEKENQSLVNRRETEDVKLSILTNLLRGCLPKGTLNDDQFQQLLEQMFNILTSFMFICSK